VDLNLVGFVAQNNVLSHITSSKKGTYRINRYVPFLVFVIDEEHCFARKYCDKNKKAHTGIK